METNEDLERGVSYSELYTYMECPRKHEYAYNRRLRKISYSNASRMNIGTVVHELIAHALNIYYRDGYDIEIDDMWQIMESFLTVYITANRPQEVTFGDEYASYSNADELLVWDRDVAVALEIAKRTIKHLDVPHKWRTVEIDWQGSRIPVIEWKFDYPLIEDRNMIGKIDWVAKSLEDGQTYLIDWKTRAKFTSDFELAGEDMNLQLSIYQHVLNSLGIETLATITYQIRSQVPAIPETTKGGRISRARIASDYETVYTAIVANGENPEDYYEFLSNIQNEDYWWLPVYIFRSEIELHSRWTTAKQIAERMVNDTLAPKFESPRCTFCPYFRVCLGEDRGFDTSNLIETAYISTLTRPDNSDTILEQQKE